MVTFGTWFCLYTLAGFFLSAFIVEPKNNLTPKQKIAAIFGSPLLLTGVSIIVTCLWIMREKKRLPIRPFFNERALPNAQHRQLLEAKADIDQKIAQLERDYPPGVLSRPNRL